MAISTYAELKQSLIDYSKRNDILSLVDTFIDIAESTMYANPDCSLRVRDMEARATASTSITTRFIALPTRYLEMRQAKLNLAHGDFMLESRTPETLPIWNRASTPTLYAVTSQVELNCISDQIYTAEFLYYQTLAPLTSGAPTNAILTRFPQIYLYGALFALYQWMMNEDRAAYYYQAFIKAIQGANNQDRRGRFHQPVIRSMEITP
jgi:hypothetical protein